MDGSTFFLYILQLRAKLEQKLRPTRIRDEKMKKYLRLAMCVVALACTTMMTSCEKDFLFGGGSSSASGSDELIGWWKANSESYYINSRGERHSWNEHDYGISWDFVFFDNNLMMAEGGDEMYRYTHDGDNITLSNFEGYDDGYGTIEKLTNKKLTFDISWGGGGSWHCVCDRVE